MEDHNKGVFNQELVLVLGAPRSGTTLLAAMLGGHPDTGILMEDYYGGAFRVLSKRLPGVKLCMPNQIELREKVSVVRVKKVVNLITRFLNKPLGILQLPLLTPQLIRSVFSIEDYICQSEKLHIVCIIRNPIDATKSEKTRAGTSDDYARTQWLRALDISSELYRRREELESFSVVTFDELVSSPRQVLDKVFACLGLQFSEAAMEGFKHTPQYKGAAGVSSDKVSVVSEANVEAFFGNDLSRLKAYQDLVLFSKS